MEPFIVSMKHRILFARPLESGHGVAVLEAAIKRDGLEIASLHKAPERTLRKARALQEVEGDGAGGAAFPSSGRPPVNAAPAAAGFPTVSAVEQNIGPDGDGIKTVADFARAGLRHDAEADLVREIQRDGDFDVPLGLDAGGEAVRGNGFISP